MDRIHPHFTVRTSFSFLLLILLQPSTEAQNICSAPSPVEFAENNSVGDVVAVITVQPGVTIKFSPPPANPDNPFRLEGNNLIAERVLDYETVKNHVASVTCTETATGLQLGISIIVLVTNVNDNPPVFDRNPYDVSVNEMSPVGTTVGRFFATDLDEQAIYYTLTPESNGFKLKSPTNPDLLVETPLDYDKVKNVQLILYAQDTPLALANSKASFTANTTIMVTILDVDNRPPWFQPCTKHEMGGALICQSAGYTSKVILNEQETGVLPLKPGPLYAIDGDSGINEEIMYSFLSGNGDGLFEIGPNTGNISMLKPADVLGTISLTVLAAQKRNSYQFATTTVTVSVQVKSLHRPKFQRPQYEGIITAVGTMAMDPKNKDEPLRIVATDDDYAATGGLNPHITYYINGSSDFSILDGYLFMTKDLPEATLSLQVVATDKTNEESATAQLVVEVTSGLTTTSLPLSTTDSMTTTSMGESTTNSKTTEDIVSTTNPSTSTASTVSSTIPSTTSENIISTTNSSMSTEGSVSTTNPVIIPSGGYGPADMAALGATLGVLLFICLVVIGVLAFCFWREKADWRKIYEASMFQSSLGQSSGGHKEVTEYTNDSFQNDEDGDSTGSGGPEGVSVTDGGEPRKAARDIPLYQAIVKSSVPLHDDTSEAGSDKADNEKEVKPILTKERRMDEGYKSVWFKEDIDPDAKEEVVIIPDSREDDSEEEDEEESSSSREEDENDNPRIKKVFFNDADLDSGLGVKMEDPAEDSDGDAVLTVDL
ncbi:cadherin-related family member 5-like isoform X2 [Siniperca chuatsi]|uniref:cadherin-related family member 5-like isoform X2 n=1 Tax=Siniperca chuatsi TaxID=119488 RepID=UPI001CE07D16|nr:cadherin-related family member 5-like isoform X2 [Siniperca chuatsi]